MVTIALPAPFKPVRRLYYDVATDVMYVSGYTAAQPFENAHWKECGSRDGRGRSEEQDPGVQLEAVSPVR
jgi:hypothetical protein